MQKYSASVKKLLVFAFELPYKICIWSRCLLKPTLSFPKICKLQESVCCIKDCCCVVPCFLICLIFCLPAYMFLSNLLQLNIKSFKKFIKLMPLVTYTQTLSYSIKTEKSWYHMRWQQKYTYKSVLINKCFLIF